MVKFKLSLLLAVIAALTVILAGLTSGARFSTILLRTLAGGLVSLVCVYLILLFAESREWLGRDTNPELQAVEDTTATDEEAAASGTDAQAAADAGQDMSEPEAAEAPAEGFQPMQAASREHMEVPSKT